MMSPAQRDRELVTDFAPACPVLRKPQMMGVARLTSADQPGLLRDKAHMIAIANTARLGMAEDGFIDRWRWHLELRSPSNGGDKQTFDGRTSTRAHADFYRSQTSMTRVESLLRYQHNRYLRTAVHESDFSASVRLLVAFEAVKSNEIV